jgi:hypothetical protein
MTEVEQKEHTSETYRSLISISIEGLKTLLLINGGAVVALLAYLGQSPQGPRLAPHVWLPLGSFVVGVGFSTLAFAGSPSSCINIHADRQERV